MAKALQTVTLEELAQHNKEGDAWIGVNGFVYNVSVFARVHPGGTGVLLR
jgi:cytochrome b involved in lipid metabolism